MSDLNETTVITDEAATRNPLVLVLAVVGALLAGALVWFFVAAPLLGGDAADDDPVEPSASAPAEVEGDGDGTATGGEAVVAEDAVLPIVTYEVFLDRDPFDPVVPEPVSASTDGTTDGTATDGTTDGTATDGTAADGSAADGSATDGSATDGGSTDGGSTDGGTTDGSGGGSTGGCTAGEDLVCDGRVVSLVEIRTADDGGRLAVIQVDTTLYEVGVGDTFAGSFRVQSINGDRIFLLYGDDAFELTVGDRVLK